MVEGSSNENFKIEQWNAFIGKLGEYLSIRGNAQSFRENANDFDGNTNHYTTEKHLRLEFHFGLVITWMKLEV